MNHLISHGATVLPVSDLPTSLAYYTEKLGFEVTFKWQEPATYAVLKAGDMSIHLSQVDPGDEEKIHPTHIYIFVFDVHKLYVHYLKQGVEVVVPLESQEYGMLDFDVKDPDGHILAFGMEAGG